MKNEYIVRQNINIIVYNQLAFITMQITSTGIKDMHTIDDIAGPTSTSSSVNLLYIINERMTNTVPSAATITCMFLTEAVNPAIIYASKAVNRIKRK